jgi:hypothetical protein
MRRRNTHQPLLLYRPFPIPSGNGESSLQQKLDELDENEDPEENKCHFKYDNVRKKCENIA